MVVTLLEYQKANFKKLAIYSLRVCVCVIQSKLLLLIVVFSFLFSILYVRITVQLSGVWRTGGAQPSGGQRMAPPRYRNLCWH